MEMGDAGGLREPVRCVFRVTGTLFTMVEWKSGGARGFAVCVCSVSVVFETYGLLKSRGGLIVSENALSNVEVLFKNCAVS